LVASLPLILGTSALVKQYVGAYSDKLRYPSERFSPVTRAALGLTCAEGKEGRTLARVRFVSHSSTCFFQLRLLATVSATACC
jgi:hypothetical protein